MNYKVEKAVGLPIYWIYPIVMEGISVSLMACEEVTSAKDAIKKFKVNPSYAIGSSLYMLNSKEILHTKG